MGAKAILEQYKKKHPLFLTTCSRSKGQPVENNRSGAWRISRDNERKKQARKRPKFGTQVKNRG